MVVTKLLGFPTTIGSSCGALFKGCVDFRDLKIKNPSEVFQDENFVSLNRLSVDVSIPSLNKDAIVFEQFCADISDITIISNTNGINGSLFVKTLQNLASAQLPKPTSSSKKTEEKSFIIEKFTIGLGTVRFVDESKKTTKEYKINYFREFKNVRDFSELGRQLISDLQKYGLTMILDTVVSSIINLPGVAIEGILNVVDKAKDVPLKAVEKVGDTIGQAGSGVVTGIKKILGQ
jgi:uncharacterized protein involved in outer membrane biogenesis